MASASEEEPVDLANVQAVRSEGQRVLQKADDMTKQRAEEESEFEVASLVGSDDTKSLPSPLPSPAAELLFDSYAKGNRNANVWDQRDNEEPDDEVEFSLGDDDDDDL